MDKIKINNQVVLMRKFVKQAKVHVINKLVKQMKLLQNRKGSEDQVMKAKRKSERFLEEITLLKKIKPDSVSKLALSKAKIWKDVLQQKDVSMEDRCLAMLANYEPVQKEIERFHNMNGNLVAKIPDLLKEWEEKSKMCTGEAAKRLKASEIKQKKEKKQKSDFKTNSKTFQKTPQNTDASNLVATDNGKEAYISKVISPKSTCNVANLKETEQTELKHDVVELKSNKVKTEKCFEPKLNFNSSTDMKNTFIDNERVLSVDDDDHLLCNMQSSGDNKATALKNIKKFSSDLRDSGEKDEWESFSTPFLKEEKNGEIDPECDTSGEIDPECDTSGEIEPESDSEINESNKEESNNSICPSELNPKMKTATDSLKAIAVLNLDELKDFEEIPLQCATDSEESEEETGNLKSDPFFLGRNETISVGDQKVERNTDDERIRYAGDGPFNSHKSNISNKWERNASFKGKNFHYSKHSNIKDDFRNGFKNRADRRKAERNFKNFQDNRNERHKFEFTKEESVFKGKRKNNFGDRERDTKIFVKDTFEKYTNKTQYNDFTSKSSIHKEKQKFFNKKDKSSEKPLHPSWEAKRKLKEAASTGFKGKRIVFDD